jgi:hypothetical protein
MGVWECGNGCDSKCFPLKNTLKKQIKEKKRRK